MLILYRKISLAECGSGFAKSSWIFDVQYKHENFTIERMDGKSGGGIKTLFRK